MSPGARRLWKPDASRYRSADDPGPQGREITHDKPYGFCYTDIRMPGQKGFAPGGISMEPEGGTRPDGSAEPRSGAARLRSAGSGGERRRISCIHLTT